jgi:ABC-type multidrug transport system ATPase subunit
MSVPGAIELQGLGVRFGGRPILHALTARLSGRAIGLLGPNGAGKTTLINTLLGFHPPSEGTAVMHGQDIVTTVAHLTGDDRLHARKRLVHRGDHRRCASSG